MAVIGLILAVIIGVAPQLFKQAANSARETDVRLLQTTINNTIARNNGAYPTFTEFQGIVGGMEWAHYNGQVDAPTPTDMLTGGATNNGLKAASSTNDESYGQNKVAYMNASLQLGSGIKQISATHSVVLPGRDVVHVWFGYNCLLAGSTLTGGNDADITDDSGTRYAAETAGGTVNQTGLPAGSIAVVYQLEGEATARCVDNQ